MHTLAKKFLESTKNRELHEDYKNSPTEEKKQHIQELFNQFYLQEAVPEFLTKSISSTIEHFIKEGKLDIQDAPYVKKQMLNFVNENLSYILECFTIE